MSDNGTLRMHVIIIVKDEFTVHDYIDCPKLEVIDSNTIRVYSDYAHPGVGYKDYDMNTHLISVLHCYKGGKPLL